MSKSQEERQNYSARREMRLRRDKTAALLTPWFLERCTVEGLAAGQDGTEIVKTAVAATVGTTDILLAELDRTRKDLAPTKSGAA